MARYEASVDTPRSPAFKRVGDQALAGMRRTIGTT